MKAQSLVTKEFSKEEQPHVRLVMLVSFQDADEDMIVKQIEALAKRNNLTPEDFQLEAGCASWRVLCAKPCPN